VRAAQETVDRQALAVRAMVESQWYEMKAAHASLKSFDAYAEQAELVASAYAEQFKIGRRSLLDVLNAENELFTARSNVTTTQMDLQLARWRLTALRGLLVDELGL
jgi:adhesin transport system outer membrane protein